MEPPDTRTTAPRQAPSTPPIVREAIRIRPDLKAALEKEADARVVGVSYLAEKFIEAGLAALPPVS